MSNPSGNPFNNISQLQQLSSDGAVASNFNVNSINKDNIFQQSVLQKLYQPPAPQEPTAKPSANEAINLQETQKLNTFLSSLGFQLGATTQNTNTPPPGVLPPLQLVARAKEGVFLVNDKDKEYLGDTSKLIYESATATLFNKDGSLLAFANQNAVGIYIFAEKRTMIFDLPNVIAIDFSNTHRYLTTIDRRENKFFISIFQPDPLRKLFEFETVRYKKETWPQLKFTENDELAFWAQKPTLIEVLNPRQNFQVVRVIETKPFDFFSISAKMENLMIVCVSLEKSAGYYGHEGCIDIYKYSDLEKGDKAPMVSKIIDKAHEVTLFFSPDGRNLLLWAQTFTDKTGQSYYGEHMLLYLELNKKSLKKVPTYKGPIHDVAWNPNGLEFIVISGFMPAGSVLFDNLCVPKFEFGQHHKNTIKWSPLSRFVCLAGFGNLPGDMEIWDVYSLKQVGTCKSHSAVSCRWAPDGRRIMTGVFNPRLRVKNNYKIFKYNGELLNIVDYSESELYEVLWKPAKYQDRPASPPKQVDKPVEQPLEKSESDKSEGGEKRVFRPKGVGSFAAQIKADKSAKAGSGGRFLSPDETFGNDPNAEGEEQKKEENGEKSAETKEEEVIKKPIANKIFRRNEKKSEDENKESGEKGNEVEQKKEPE